MKQPKFSGVSLLGIVILSTLLFFPISVIASNVKLEDNFNKQKDTWHFTNFEGVNGVQARREGTLCGIDACTSYKKQNGDKFLRIAINPSQNPGFYLNTDVSEEDLGNPSTTTGRFTPSVGNPVVMEARVRWSAGYAQDGSGAVGTSGIILWNAEVTPQGPTSEYDHIGFLWSHNTILGGYLAGLTSNTTVNLNPISVNRPTFAVDLQNWVNLKLVWSEDANAQQTVKYYVSNNLIATDVLPVRLENLSMEMWTDNQEPQFDANFNFFFAYPNPTATQYMDVDKLEVEID